jgi:hypothetical protein
MIRDFCSIKRKRLIDEINALRKEVAEGRAPVGVTPETVEAINEVRKVGNIGAHMEADIDHIVPVDPGEAQLLIGLIEMLFEEWYVDREKRKALLADLTSVAQEKARLIAGETKPETDQLTSASSDPEPARPDAAEE